MEIGFVGLGKMGANMVRRLLQGGHKPIVTNRGKEAIQVAVSEGATGADDLAGVVAKLRKDRLVFR